MNCSMPGLIRSVKFREGRRKESSVFLCRLSILFRIDGRKSFSVKFNSQCKQKCWFSNVSLLCLMKPLQTVSFVIGKAILRGPAQKPLRNKYG